MAKVCGIYGIQNTLTGKWYVGQSTNVYNRMSFHFSELRRGIHFSRQMQADFDKYGPDAFRKELLEVCEQDQLNEIEQKWIVAKDAIAHGYNQMLGGLGCPHRIASDEHRRRMREAMSGENNPNFGKSTPEETRMKISNTMRGKCGHLRKPVVCVETGAVYESISAAAKAVGRTFSSLSEARKKGMTCGGFHWKFHEEVSA